RVLDAEGEEGPGCLAEGLDGITIGGQTGALFDQRSHTLGEHGVVDRLLGREVGVEGLVAHVDRQGEVSEREAGESTGSRQSPGGSQDLFLGRLVSPRSPVKCSSPCHWSEPTPRMSTRQGPGTPALLWLQPGHNGA